MKTITLTLLLVLLPLSVAHSKPWYRHSEANRWTGEDTVRELVSVELRLFDLWQTRYIARHPTEFFETNPYLGKHPSIEEVNRFFLITTVTHGLISYALPRKWRTGWQYITIGVQINTVQKNKAIGVRFEY